MKLVNERSLRCKLCICVVNSCLVVYLIEEKEREKESGCILRGRWSNSGEGDCCKGSEGELKGKEEEE